MMRTRFFLIIGFERGDELEVVPFVERFEQDRGTSNVTSAVGHSG